ncbi:AMP-dependent synthetase/ligase [Actinomadura rupiterrae]|uniref:AMP-dependent synthetase/ligase n=1 Tax=Actinomadura rupiterrae TaxID=559627 RepID=UPI0020A53F5C|nr:AMP-dependent synthetase/ligase [Actinomadura rupiterrae]MCP2338475.1 long-chain acyl-CoA synthetase [Actinomadura rupiterrae]
MRETDVPVRERFPETANLTDTPFDRAAGSPGRIVARRRVPAAAPTAGPASAAGSSAAPTAGSGSSAGSSAAGGSQGAAAEGVGRPAGADAWAAVTAGEFADEVARLAKGLIAVGVEPGDRIALMSRTRYEWTVLDYAIWAAGGVTVPVYETSSPEQLAWILGDSGARGIFVETAENRAAVASVRAELPELSQVSGLEPDDLDRLAGWGAAVTDEQLTERRRSRRASDLATIVYTSGTTGRPRGCALTHANFLATARNVVLAGVPEIAADGASTLLFLPLAHVFARLVQVGCVECGMVLAHGTPGSLQKDLGTFQPTFLLAVPRVFEKVYNGAAQRAEADGKGRIFAAAADTAVAYSQALDTGRVPLALKARHRVFDALVYRKLRAAMGGRLRYAMSGGAALNARLGHFFRGIGVTIIEGYGLTETTAPIVGNRFTPGGNRIGTVGRPFPGTGLRIADDGEILARGVSIFEGYWNDPDATARALDGGWFHTGDLGELDDDGYLRITGRKKDILVTAGGKNVAPGPLEDLLRAHPLIDQAVVVGDGRKFIGALLTLDEEALPGWLATRGRPVPRLGDGLDLAALRDDPEVRTALDAAVAEANATVSHAEAIKKYRVLDRALTEAGGHLTPSLKVRRHIVTAAFATDIEALYT